MSSLGDGPLGRRCPGCGSRESAPVLTFPAPVPVLCNAFPPTRERALTAPAGCMALVICRRCSLLWNTAFDPRLADYESNYDNSLHYSGVFTSYAESLVQRLSKHHLAGRSIVEIGCGDASLLDRLCDLTGAVGVGIDPSFGQKPRRQFRSPHVTVHSRLFEPGDGEGAALVIARHVLEHVADPAAFLRLLLGNKEGAEPASIYLEVPSADYMIRSRAFWDLIYEHPTYFTHDALTQLMAATGWQTTDGGESFHGQYLWMEARPAEEGGGQGLVCGPTATVASAGDFGAVFEEHLHRADEFVRSRAADGDVVLWGAGSKAVTLLNLLPSRHLIKYAVDINPAKQAMFIPGTGHRVLAPESLREVAPATVLVMNNAYTGEVQATMTGLGIAGSVVTMPGSPS